MKRNIQIVLFATLGMLLLGLWVIFIPKFTFASEQKSRKIPTFSAFDFIDGIGVNTHLEYPTAGQWGNYPYLEAMITAIGFHNFRDSLNALPGNNQVFLNIHNRLIDDGLHADLIATDRDTTAMGPAWMLQHLRGYHLAGIRFFEGPNELNYMPQSLLHRSDTDWRKHVIEAVALTAKPAMNSVFLRQYHIRYIAASILPFADDPATVGDLGSAVDAVNIHDYTSGYEPETSGWGGYYWGHRYGSLQYEKTAAQRLTAADPKPVISTEFGFNVGYLPNEIHAHHVSGQDDEYTQAAYLERMMLWHYLHGIRYQYMYDLFDEEPGGDDHHWGLVRADGSQRMAAPALQGFLHILADSQPLKKTCHIPMNVEGPEPTETPNFPNTHDRYEVMGFCKNQGEKDIVFWSPQSIYDPIHGHRLTTVKWPITFQILPNAKIRRMVLWSQDINYHWTGHILHHNLHFLAEDRPEILVLDGPQPTPLPSLPTPPST